MVKHNGSVLLIRMGRSQAIKRPVIITASMAASIVVVGHIQIRENKYTVTLIAN